METSVCGAISTLATLPAAFASAGTTGVAGLTTLAGVTTTGVATTTGATTGAVNDATAAPTGTFPAADGKAGRGAFAVAVSTSIWAKVGMETTGLATAPTAAAVATPAGAAAMVALVGLAFSVMIWAPVARACSVTRHDGRLRPRVGSTATGAAAGTAVINAWGAVPKSATGSSIPASESAGATPAPVAATGRAAGSGIGCRLLETERKVGALSSAAGTTDWFSGDISPGTSPAAAATAGSATEATGTATGAADVSPLGATAGLVVMARAAAGRDTLSVVGTCA
ncbi:MAG: hypothetical protein IPL39_15995 [Opitutaceae bacterium]|nr:hypothetical protein [Opitutaceae bacterium]